MALATRCPACHSVFRVVADQLKLRGGLVRCGQCNMVFDAINALTYLDDTQLRQALGAAPAPSAPAPVATAHDAADAAPPDRRSPDFLIEPEPAPATTEAQAGDASPTPHGAASPLPERAAAAMRELAAALDLVPALSLSPSPTHPRIEATASTAAALGQEAPAENEAATTDAKFEPEDSAASGSAE
ncbi:MAG: zinc-ribbon domain-containing protein, partial [Burkholderiaceae bacterium]